VKKRWLLTASAALWTFSWSRRTAPDDLLLWSVPIRGSFDNNLLNSDLNYTLRQLLAPSFAVDPGLWLQLPTYSSTVPGVICCHTVYCHSFGRNRRFICWEVISGGYSIGKPAERRAFWIEAMTPGQCPAYNNRLRASASSQLITVLLPKKFNGTDFSKRSLEREPGGMHCLRQWKLLSSRNILRITLVARFCRTFFGYHSRPSRWKLDATMAVRWIRQPHVKSPT